MESLACNSDKYSSVGLGEYCEKYTFPQKTR